MTTCQAVISRARYPLSDSDVDEDGSAITPRQSNAELLGYLNDGLAEALNLRPDLNFASIGIPFTPRALGDDFPLPIQHEAPLIGYVVFRAESKDDEAVNSGRAALFRALFEKQIVSL